MTATSRHELAAALSAVAGASLTVFCGLRVRAATLAVQPQPQSSHSPASQPEPEPVPVPVPEPEPEQEPGWLSDCRSAFTMDDSREAVSPPSAAAGASRSSRGDRRETRTPEKPRSPTGHRHLPVTWCTVCQCMFETDEGDCPGRHGDGAHSPVPVNAFTGGHVGTVDTLSGTLSCGSPSPSVVVVVVVVVSTAAAAAAAATMTAATAGCCMS
jgi:hypothetical protein